MSYDPEKQHEAYLRYKRVEKCKDYVAQATKKQRVRLALATIHFLCTAEERFFRKFIQKDYKQMTALKKQGRSDDEVVKKANRRYGVRRNGKGGK